MKSKDFIHLRDGTMIKCSTIVAIRPAFDDQGIRVIIDYGGANFINSVIEYYDSSEDMNKALECFLGKIVDES